MMRRQLCTCRPAIGAAGPECGKIECMETDVAQELCSCERRRAGVVRGID